MYRNSSYATMSYSGSRMNMNQMNGNGRRGHPNPSKVVSSAPPVVDNNTSSSCAQQDEIIRFIFSSWSKVSQEVDKNTGTSMYYHEREHTNLRDFEPFNLEEYWGRRVVQSMQHSQQHS